ncbi:MAG: hypothetical protein KGI06_02015 [Candidatus Micrarchaeota archaeon]|nr:hypothetical protein [Candidatus Micrarchaeota archaeon]
MISNMNTVTRHNGKESESINPYPDLLRRDRQLSEAISSPYKELRELYLNSSSEVRAKIACSDATPIKLLDEIVESKSEIPAIKEAAMDNMHRFYHHGLL